VQKSQQLRQPLFLENVTAIWVPPGSQPLDASYYNACLELQKWAGPNWVNNQETFFFPIRRKLIKICEKWRSHDWKSDVNLIKEKREDAKHLPGLGRSFSLFSLALKKAPFKLRKWDLGLAFLAELCPDADIVLTNEQGIAAVERAVDQFRQHLKIRSPTMTQYGPIEYSSLPRQLPEREIAIALCLASCISVWRRDGLAEGSHIAWQKPVITRNLPWKSIALFAWANPAKGEQQLEAEAIQKRVTSLAKKVMLVDLRSS
jgi:hypothetical protein